MSLEVRFTCPPDLFSRPIPSLDPGVLPKPYIELGSDKRAGPSKLRDLEVEHAERSTARTVPKAPVPPPSAQSGKTLTKKEKKAVRLRECF